MSGAIVGALRIVLGADTAALDKGLKDSRSSVAAFGAAVATGMAAAAAAVAAAAAGIGIAMTRTIDDMDKLSKSSAKLGIPIEQLSALAYAADLSDVSFESLSKGVAKLSKTMVEAAAKPTSEAANAFRALGVSVKDSDGRLKSSQEVLGDVADRFAGLKDGAGKTAVSIALFGRAGADLIPLLNDGKEGLKKMSDEAKQWGAVFDDKTGKAAQDFNDNLTKLSYAWKGIVVQSVSQVLPTLVEISNRMVETAKNSGILQTSVTVLSTAMKALVSGGVIVGAVFKTLSEYISTVSQAIALVIKGQFTQAFDAVKGGVAGVGETATHAFETIDRLWKGQQSGADAAAASTDKATDSQKDFNYAALSGKNAVEQFLQSQAKSIAGRQAELQTDGMAAGAKERLKLANEAYAIAAANGIAPSEALRAKISETANAAGLLGLQLGNLSLIGPGVTGNFAAMWTAIEATNQKLAEGGLKAQDNARLMQQSAELTQKFWADTGTSVAGSIGELGQAFAGESKKMAAIAKVAGIVQATIAMFQAGAEALKLGFPAGIPAAAAILAKGAAMVAGIKSVSVAGFSSGGFVMGPGSGLSDSIPAMLSNGEFVMNAEATSRYRPQLEEMNSGGGGGTRVINVSGLGRDSYSRDEVRKIIEGINDAVGDGYKLRVA